MSQSSFRKILAGVLLAGSTLWCAALPAETLEELDALSDVTTDEAAGIAAAREQSNRGEYLEALATLERVLAVHPKSHEARLIHALYLCQVDDKQGGLVEIGKLNEKQYGKQLLADARAVCGKE